MNNVIEFPSNDGTGYIMSENNIDGAYVNDIAAIVDNYNVYLGTKGDGEIQDPLLTSKDDLNTFCLMWLAIYKPSALVEGD